jgi:hypothetical protein
VVSSKVCCFEDFNQDWYIRWAEAIRLEAEIRNTSTEKRDIHRKLWEWCAIAEVLQQRGMLQAGRKGVGFAVGTEPLASTFAAAGVSVLGTDLGSDEAGWTTTNQHAASLEALYYPPVVDRETFTANVRFQPADMRNVSSMAERNFDFIWSSCAFEHLGSLDAGFRFVMDGMQLIKPGGFAVHTTEYNVSSNDETMTSGSNVIYRRRDIEELGYAMRGIGCVLETPDFDAGSDRHDIEFDFPPYFKNNRKHIKLLLGPYVATSILLVIKKGAPPPVEAVIYNPLDSKSAP